MWEAPTVGFGPIVDTTSLASGADGPIFCAVRWYLDGRSGRDAYDTGHLPGAVFVDLEEHLTAKPGPEVGRHPLPDPDDLARSLGSLGVGPADPVVAYDAAGGMSATPEPLSVTGEMSSRWTPGLDTFRGLSMRRLPPTWSTVGSWPLKPWPTVTGPSGWLTLPRSSPTAVPG